MFDRIPWPRPDLLHKARRPEERALFDLLMYTDTSDGQVKGQTAESLTSSDAVVWTLKIKPNIKFTDGTPYDAAAVKFNWTRIADPNIPVNRWSAGMTHDQWLPFGFKGYADVLRVSDDLFLREINVFTFNPGVDVALRTRRFERSRVGIERLFDDGLLIATGTW